MELAQVQAFVEAVQRGSISRAADALAVSQPALTARIRQLERELGEPLLVRHVSGVTPTEAGSRFLPKVKQALTALQQGIDDVRQIRDATGGILRVGVSRQLAPSVLPAVMSRFARDHPKVEVQVRTGMSSPLAALVSAGEVELALVVRPLRLPELRTTRLYDDRLHFVISPRHPLARRRSVTMSDLGKAGLVLR
ncbi:MAG TPA: LysR family transcriptional regulator, partial [Dehalococcoidia bacterium]|nr:LysR family transcriptional regulator [Dehalococcoidia bacterium]